MVALNPFEEALAAHLPDGAVASAFREAGLPTRRAEAWKWSDLRSASKTARPPSTPYALPIPASPLSIDGAREAVFANGQLRDGAAFVAVSDAAATLLPSAPVASLATASAVHELVLDGTVPTTVVRRLSDGAGAHADRLHVVVRAGAAALLIETHEISGSPFVNSLTTLHLEEGASLTRIIVQPAADEALAVHTSFPTLEDGASLRQMTVALGAAFARHETELELRGTSDVQFDAAYRLNDNLHCDLTSRIKLIGPGSTVGQLTKGVVSDRARAVFQGKFFVERTAQQTDAKMGHHAINLTDGASVNAKPELEIYADDVECAHGNTVGALDEDALFYLQQRGLSLNAARQMLIEAFYAEVFDRIDDEGIRRQLTALIGGGA